MFEAKDTYSENHISTDLRGGIQGTFLFSVFSISWTAAPLTLHGLLMVCLMVPNGVQQSPSGVPTSMRLH